MEGDSNTKYFHAYATTRKAKRFIIQLKDDNGDMLSDQESMCRVVKDYFIKLFSHADSRVEEGLVNNNIVITEAQNYKLTEEFTFDYFSLVVKQMHRDKSVGPDGLNPAFYQNFWNVLGQEVFQCYLKWLNEVSFPTKLNDTTIVLVPKRDGADCMKDLRPIALCNVYIR